MSHHLLGIGVLALAGIVGWFCAKDADQGFAELPRTMWRVERRFDPTLFWLFTGLNCFVIAAAVFAGVALLLDYA
ncbi:MAG: hypothetical protein ACRYFW_11520 [Janthinobacterium lividum]